MADTLLQPFALAVSMLISDDDDPLGLRESPMISFVLWFASVQAVVLAISLSAPRHRVGCERLLALLLVVIAVDVAMAAIILAGGLHDWPHLLRLSTPTALLLAPLAYFVIRGLLGNLPNTPIRWWVHALPAFGVAIYFVPLYLAQATEKLTYLERLSQAPLPLESYWLGALKRLQMAAYLLAAWNLILRSDLRGRPRLPAILVGTTFALIWLGDMYDYAFDFGFGTTTDKAQMLGVALVVLLMTVTVLLHAQVVPRASRYRTPAPDAQESRKLLSTLTQRMATEKLFLNPQLTLSALADTMSTTTHELSRVINQHFGENFSSFVNRHRVERAKRLLDDPNLRICDVCEQAGFNSSSTFNAAFRRVVGVSPRQYRRRLTALPS